MFFQYRYQGIVIGPIAAYVSVYDEVILHCDLHVVRRFELNVYHVVILHAHEGGFHIRL